MLRPSLIFQNSLSLGFLQRWKIPFRWVTSQTGQYQQTQVSESHIDLGIGQPSPFLLPVDLVVSSSIKRAKQADDPLFLQYGDVSGYLGFR
jgi:hypothetical protein